MMPNAGCSGASALSSVEVERPAKPKLSILTVVLNDLPGLQATWASIHAQTYVDYEWVVWDGGSGEATEAFLADVDSPLTWHSEADRGIYDAMNKCLALCSGEYVVFLNAGDTFPDPRVLERVMDALAGSTPDVLFGGATLRFYNGRTIARPPRRAENYLWHGLPGNHQATYYRRELLGLAPYDLRYRICGDYYLAATLLRQGASAAYLDSLLVCFEMGGASWQHLKNLLLEPYSIQKNILHVAWPLRILSMSRRLRAIAAAWVLQRI